MHQKLSMSCLSFLHLLPLLLTPAFAATAHPPENDLSIGASYPLSPDRHTIPHFTLHAPKGNPQLLSDRIILTPPAPGYQRAGVWSQSPVPFTDFSVDLSFRVHGQERPGGALTLWYTSKQADAETVYESRGWDGLAVVVDTVEGKGTVRAYLNDGSRNYALEKRPASLAFGHCELVYRNRGILSRLSVVSAGGMVRVEVDGNLCFESKKTHLPKGNYLGVTAATLDPPDSFELFSLLTTSLPASAIPPGSDQQQNQSPPQQQQQQQQQQQKVYTNPDGSKWTYHAEPAESDREATHYTTQSTQFADLHDRLQALTHHIAELQFQNHALKELIEKVVRRQEEVAKTIDTAISPKLSRIEDVKSQLQSLHLLTIDLANTLTNSKDHTADFARLKQHIESKFEESGRRVVENVHQRVETVVKEHRVRWGWVLLAVVGAQVGGVVGWRVWKKRRGGVKKYL
ncbi:concanavalin A-like lectin/glucanase [Ascodesmis nigricans]|uniref:Concanavalin A-like lectin/glucanase n=1 Tax=Ascodesmis nigricans TaxID=341454 RepID=A0A4S2MN69_9PEZI|nr:concanavalin A-like lectin/glucanase [Ascodesmis nigricans]